MRLRYLIALVFFSFLLVEKTAAQDIRRDTLPLETRRDSSIRFFGTPLVFYSPDTRWGIGAAGIITFPTRPRRSNLSFDFSYTQNDQTLVFFPFQWLSNRNVWRAYGEVGWYRYFYQYFGIGNRYPNDFRETYTAKFPRIRFTAAAKVQETHLLGLRFFLDGYTIVSATPGGEIANNLITGAAGGISSSIGPVWISDSRDNSFYPKSGWLSEFALIGENRLTGSDFKFVRCSLDVARYFSIGQNVLAVNGIAMFSAGDVPFFQLSQIGGARRLRGYPIAKYSDRHLLITQAEFRFPIAWRFKGVVFGGAGAVYGRAGETARIRPNAGAGLRFMFDRRQKLHLRLDYGIGEGRGNAGFYVTVGEAF